MTLSYIVALAVASLPCLFLGSRYAWASLSERWRFRVRLAARRLYIVGPLAALTLAGCDGGGLLVVESIDAGCGDAGCTDGGQ